MADNPLPERVDQYRVIRRIAYGGMAEVLLGEVSGADGFTKSVVIKRVLPQHCDNNDFVTMFRDEARITSRLHHGNIVQVINFGESAGQHYLVLEYVNGPSLGVLLDALGKKGERLSVAEAAHITGDVARALDYAHRKRSDDGMHLQIVHRDVSPANVLVSREGEVKLADFGIARARSRLTPTMQGSGVLKGKLAYMAPETVTQGFVDARSDLFALGAVLYEMLTGKPAFSGQSEAETIHRVLKGEVPRVSSTNPEAPPELDALVDSLLAPDPEDRPQRAFDVLQAVSPFSRTGDLSAEELLARTVERLFPRSREAARSQPKKASEKPTVLVVEQSRTMRAFLKAALTSKYQVIEASSLKEAQDQVDEDLPSAVICQRSLPDATGLEVCRAMRSDPRGQSIGFVMLASDVSPELAKEAEEAGVDAIVPKQADAGTILERVTLAILHRGSLSSERD